MTPIIYQTPAEFIKKCRWWLRMTQEELALELALEQAQISTYETGKVMPPAQVVIGIVNLFQRRGMCPFCDIGDTWQK